MAPIAVATFATAARMAGMAWAAAVLVDGPAPGTKLVSDPGPALGDGQAIKEKTP